MRSSRNLATCSAVQAPAGLSSGDSSSGFVPLVVIPVHVQPVKQGLVRRRDVKMVAVDDVRR